jgi:hypothetical protein
MKARISILFTVTIFFAGAAFFFLKNKGSATLSAPAHNLERKPLESDIIKPLADMTLGDEAAPHTLVTYFAPSCPHCSGYEQEDFPKVEDAFVKTGKLRVVFRIIPMNELDFFVARLCYGSQDALKNIMFFLKNQDSWLKPVLEKPEKKTKLLAHYEKTVADKLGMNVSDLQETLKKEMDLKKDMAFLMLFALENGFSMDAVKKAVYDDQEFDNSLAMGGISFKRRNGTDITEVPFFSIDGYDIEGLATLDVLEKQLRFFQKT